MMFDDVHDRYSAVDWAIEDGRKRGLKMKDLRGSLIFVLVLVSDVVWKVQLRVDR
jgi:hypothetical protein